MSADAAPHAPWWTAARPARCAARAPRWTPRAPPPPHAPSPPPQQQPPPLRARSASAAISTCAAKSAYGIPSCLLNAPPALSCAALSAMMGSCASTVRPSAAVAVASSERCSGADVSRCDARVPSVHYIKQGGGRCRSRRRVRAAIRVNTRSGAHAHRLGAAEVGEGAVNASAVAVAATVRHHVAPPDLHVAPLRARQHLVAARRVVLPHAARGDDLHAAVRAGAGSEFAPGAVRRQLLRAAERAGAAVRRAAHVPGADERRRERLGVVHPGRACGEQLRAQLHGALALRVLGGEAREPRALRLDEVEEALLQQHERRIARRPLKQRRAQLLRRGGTRGSAQARAPRTRTPRRRTGTAAAGAERRRTRTRGGLGLAARRGVRGRSRLEHQLRRVGRRSERLGVRVQHGGVRSGEQQTCARGETRPRRLRRVKLSRLVRARAASQRATHSLPGWTWCPGPGSCR